MAALRQTVSLTPDWADEGLDFGIGNSSPVQLNLCRQLVSGGNADILQIQSAAGQRRNVFVVTEKHNRARLFPEKPISMAMRRGDNTVNSEADDPLSDFVSGDGILSRGLSIGW